MDCVKACPTRAIRVRDGVATAMWELCIDCGECVRVCRYDAALSLTSSPAELKKFQYKIAMPSPVLYTQFGRQVHPDRVLQALKMIGFDEVYDETWICEMVSAAIDTYLTECSGPWPRISTTCPKVRSLYREHYFAFEREIKTRPVQPLAPTITEGAAKAKEKLAVLGQLPKKDCAACGAPDCKTFADDVIRGRAKMSDCLFVRLEELGETIACAPVAQPSRKVPSE